MRALGRVEKVVLAYVREHGPTSPADLEGTAKSAYRVLGRLARLGVLVKTYRGTYELPKPSHERVQEARERARSIDGAAPRADAALPTRRVKKGARLIVADEAPLPGDVVLVGTRIGILRSFGYAPGTTRPRTCRIEYPRGAQTEHKLEGLRLRKVSGSFSRFTRAAAAERAAVPEPKAPPAKSPLWWAPPPEAKAG